jgi:hypothetical protein
VTPSGVSGLWYLKERIEKKPLWAFFQCLLIANMEDALVRVVRNVQSSANDW